MCRGSERSFIENLDQDSETRVATFNEQLFFDKWLSSSLGCRRRHSRILPYLAESATFEGGEKGNVMRCDHTA